MISFHRRALILAAVAALMGCEQLTGPSELERAIAAEQEAIAAYSEKVPEVDALQRRFAEAWKEATELKDVKAFREAVETRVIPALDAYVSAVKAMPAETEELARIHGTMVAAYTKAREAFGAFVDGLAADNLIARYDALMKEMDENVYAADERYREELKTYYAKNRVRLVEQE